MAHFAKVEDGIVTQVIVADQDFIDNHCTGTWIQTSYNTRYGEAIARLKNLGEAQEVSDEYTSGPIRKAKT